MNDRARAGLSRRAFMYLSGLAAVALGRSGAGVAAETARTAPSDVSEWNKLLGEVKRFPLLDALYGRRSRRFGWGMEIPHGPLAYKSELPPTPLDDFERAMLVAAGLGVSGWHHGIPFTAGQEGLCDYAVRYTGRTLPVAAGIGNTDLFYTQDDGTYYVSTRNADGDTRWDDAAMSEAEQLIAMVGAHTRKLSDRRIDPPREAPHYSAHNFWNGNTPGSTLFIPVGNVSEQMLDFLFIAAGSGYTTFDDLEGRPAGDLQRFFDLGLIDPQRKYPLSYMEQYLLTTCAVEMGVMGHNMALALQPLGLGGWFYSGVSPFSVMGAAAKAGEPGLGFAFEKKEGWGVPNPLGIEGLYQAFSPPHYPDMRSAVEAFLELKFGPGGAYDAKTAGPFRDNAATKATATRPSKDLIDCVVATAEYIYATYGKFPGTVPSIFVRYYTQAHRLETGFYDKFFGPGSYLDTHRHNVTRWLTKVRA
ncbi:MAG: hypothetical protein RLW61_18975 [Gammaproteobacteria bacterium]